MSGMVFIISAPSGSGKSTLTNRLLSLVPDLKFSVSYTTRPPRGSEISGREYFYVGRDEFDEMVRNGEFLEHAEVFGNCYGTARSYMNEAFQQGKNLLLDIDVQGAAQVKSKLPEAVSIFVLPPSREELERRLRTRSEADDEIQRKLHGDKARRFTTEGTIQRRLQTASREIENFRDYDYILVNDRVDPAIDTLKSIVRAELLRRAGVPPGPDDQIVLDKAEEARRPRMMGQVQSILASFDLSRHPTLTE
jgi:guanylate kinase